MFPVQDEPFHEMAPYRCFPGQAIPYFNDLDFTPCVCIDCGEDVWSVPDVPQHRAYIESYRWMKRGARN